MVASTVKASNEALAALQGAKPDVLGDALGVIHAALDSADLCFGHGTDNAWDESVLLLLCACGLPVDSGDEVLGKPVDAGVWQTVREWTRARIEQRVPLPYLLGRAWFAGLEFKCDARALVPRSPLAELITADYGPWWSGAAPRSILDLCCGGGSIGVAAAVYSADSSVILADLDADALALAQENIDYHSVGNRVTALHSDLFEQLGARRFDIILCNPPYVDADDLAAMPDEYHREPPAGLGSGRDGLDLTRRILRDASRHLSPGGLLFLELGNSWETLDGLLPDQALTWLEFSNGGHGVLLATADELPDIAAALGEK